MTDKKRLERAKEYYYDSLTPTHTREALEDIFPELAESEDERIRKALIRLFQAESTESFGEFTNKQFIAWLEKQCKEKTVAVDIDQMVDDFSRQEIKGYGIPSMIEVDAYRKGISDVIALHNKRFKCSTNDNCSKLLNKDKTLNNLPKFKVGDWLCANELNNYANLIEVIGIVDIFGKERYTVSRDYDSNLDLVEFDFIEKYYHLWTIQDAKDGDVLMSRAPFIYGKQCSYGGLNWFNGKFVKASNYMFTDSPVHPATKEQCDLLFSKIKDAGYEWNIEKKELRKIEKQSEKSKTKLKFKVGDKVTNGENTYTIHYIAADCYWVEEHSCVTIPFEAQDYWELVQEQVDGFDAELNALLKKYEHSPREELDTLLKKYGYLPKEELAECLSFYLRVIQGEQTQVTCPYCKNTNCTYVDGHWFCLDCHREFNTMEDEQKPKWSEEDDSILQGILDEILANKHDAKEYDWKTYDKYLEWLKSLKKRMEK